MEIHRLQFIQEKPPALDATAPGTTVWQDVAGKDVAYGATHGEWHWLQVVGAGSYRFPVRTESLAIKAQVVPDRRSRPDIVIDSYYRTIVPVALQAYGCETLHGSAISLRGEVVALCAQPETGKSTIAFAMGQRGHPPVADDAVVISLETGRRRPREATDTGQRSPDRPLVHPLPFALRLRETTAEHFASPSKAAVRVNADSAAGDTDEPLPLAAVVMLARRKMEGAGGTSGGDGHEIMLTRLSPSEAFTALLSQSLTFTLADKRRKRSMMRSYFGLAAAIPVFGLSYPTGLEHLGAICDRLEGLAAEPVPVR